MRKDAYNYKFALKKIYIYLLSRGLTIIENLHEKKYISASCQKK